MMQEYEGEEGQQQQHTTCFFWCSRDEGAVPYARGDAFLSQPVYSQSQSAASQAGQSSTFRPYKAAERIYCYDSIAEQANRNVVTVFMQNSQEEQKLVRLAVSAEERSYAIAMAPRARSSSSSGSSGSSSSETSLQDNSLQDFSDYGVTGFGANICPKTGQLLYRRRRTTRNVRGRVWVDIEVSTLQKGIRA